MAFAICIVLLCLGYAEAGKRDAQTQAVLASDYQGMWGWGTRFCVNTSGVYDDELTKAKISDAAAYWYDHNICTGLPDDSVPLYFAPDCDQNDASFITNYISLHFDTVANPSPACEYSTVSIETEPSDPDRIRVNSIMYVGSCATLEVRKLFGVALGFFYEESRSDRDKYLQVCRKKTFGTEMFYNEPTADTTIETINVFDLIQGTVPHSHAIFPLAESNQLLSLNLGPYDTDSIMHSSVTRYATSAGVSLLMRDEADRARLATKTYEFSVGDIRMFEHLNNRCTPSSTPSCIVSTKLEEDAFIGELILMNFNAVAQTEMQGLLPTDATNSIFSNDLHYFSMIVVNTRAMTNPNAQEMHMERRSAKYIPFEIVITEDPVWTTGPTDTPDIAVGSVDISFTTSLLSNSTSTVECGSNVTVHSRYLGCYSMRGVDTTVLTNEVVNNGMSKDRCVAHCMRANASASYAVLSQGTRCHCGSGLRHFASQPSSDCGVPCAFGGTGGCGGYSGGGLDFFGVYQVRTFDPQNDYGSQAVDIPAGVTYQHVACMENNIGRLNDFWLRLDVVTVENCLKHCGKYGYLAAGLRGQNECYCSMQLDISFGITGYDCELPCADGGAGPCGNSSNNQVAHYLVPLGFRNKIAHFDKSPPYAHAGCFHDVTTTGTVSVSSVQQCLQHCLINHERTMVSISSGNICGCVEQKEAVFSLRASKDLCTAQCPGDSDGDASCGGSTTVVSNLYYGGHVACISDGDSCRIRSKKYTNLEMTPSMCIAYCLAADSSHNFAEIENGVDCYCTDSHVDVGFHNDGVCNMNCPGHHDFPLSCGGRESASVYIIRDSSSNSTTDAPPASVLPRGVNLHANTADLFEDLPLAAGYKYVTCNAEYVLVVVTPQNQVHGYRYQDGVYTHEFMVADAELSDIHDASCAAYVHPTPGTLEINVVLIAEVLSTSSDGPVSFTVERDPDLTTYHVSALQWPAAQDENVVAICANDNGAAHFVTLINGIVEYSVRPHPSFAADPTDRRALPLTISSPQDVLPYSKYYPLACSEQFAWFGSSNGLHSILVDSGNIIETFASGILANGATFSGISDGIYPVTKPAFPLRVYISDPIENNILALDTFADNLGGEIPQARAAQVQQFGGGVPPGGVPLPPGGAAPLYIGSVAVSDLRGSRFMEVTADDILFAAYEFGVVAIDTHEVFALSEVHHLPFVESMHITSNETAIIRGGGTFVLYTVEVVPTTPEPIATDAPDTLEPTPAPPITPVPTPLPDTDAPPTPAPTTEVPVTLPPLTPAPATPSPPTPAPTTLAPPTPAPTTLSPPTPAPSTLAPTTDAPETDVPVMSTDAPPTASPGACCKTSGPGKEMCDGVERDQPLCHKRTFGCIWGNRCFPGMKCVTDEVNDRCCCLPKQSPCMDTLPGRYLRGNGNGKYSTIDIEHEVQGVYKARFPNDNDSWCRFYTFSYSNKFIKASYDCPMHKRWMLGRMKLVWENCNTCSTVNGIRMYGWGLVQKET